MTSWEMDVVVVWCMEGARWFTKEFLRVRMVWHMYYLLVNRHDASRLTLSMH
jgi:hypothetical protein